MKKIRNKEKHLRRYIGLAIIFFTLELLLQGTVIFAGWNITVGNFSVPTIVNYQAAFISIAMIFMGIYYFIKYEDIL